MLNHATERFEQRLQEECGAIRYELREATTRLQADMQILRSDVIAALATTRADLIKWAFVFWAGQLAAVVGIIAVLK